MNFASGNWFKIPTDYDTQPEPDPEAGSDHDSDMDPWLEYMY